MFSTICICPPPLLVGKSPFSVFSIPSLVRTAPRFPSLKTGARRNRFGSQTAADPVQRRKPDGLGIENTDEDERLHWEDQILEDTVPLVAFVRMILQPGKYESGDRLSAEHENTILERLLPYHPGFERKIGCGMDYITIGYHPDFENSRCLFIVRKDGQLVDFSYWKCIKGLIKKKYPLYADSFIFKHFRRHE
ncbi:protein DCL homolog, chloroplastic-like [Magnolia sinica]|uniref:protein DCL homolog, chloroplastic-like n=1 Tax=Magnolia sinica TaxID=86752 RepID=UPI00265A6D14|nr:protein DCL homolog, chloroplastic-like [Magnolia sinica]